MKRLLVLLILLLASPSYAQQCSEDTQVARLSPAIVGGGVPSGDYCSTTTWNTFTAFRLDLDHTTDTKTACLASSTQVGDLNGTPSISNPTPTSTGIGSGGNAINPDANTEYLIFDNTASIFQSQYGELMMKAKAANTVNDMYPLRIFHDVNNDVMMLSMTADGYTGVLWKDHGSGYITATITSPDYDSYLGDWIQIHVKWDTTRCSAGAGDACSDAGEDELCIRVRIDANNDGDFGDGGAEDWSAWACETSATNLDPWTAEPGDNDITVGIPYGTYGTSALAVDDLEISNAQPSW